MRDLFFNAHGLRRLHDTMSELVEDGELPGIVALISQGAKVHVDAVGTHEFGSGPPMRRDTIFRIASTTKPMVAAAALCFVDDGKLRLDEPIDRWLPVLANRRVLKSLTSPLDDTVPAVRPILVSDLLTMRMGSGDIMSSDEYPIRTAMTEAGINVPYQMPTVSLDEWLARLGALPLMDQPGEVWRYNLSSTVLGALLVRVAGKSLGEVMAARLFEPLGMKDTGFSVPPEKLQRLPSCYQPNRLTKTMDVWDPAGPKSF